MSDILMEARVFGGVTTHYVDESGNYLGGWDSNPPDNAIEINPPPVYADQIWQFPGWGSSLTEMRMVESQWREAELVVIANQLDALEEAVSGEIPSDLLPGTREQWLSHRGKVRNWKEGAESYPDHTKRPVRPS